MKKIYLIRHAKSDWDDPSLTDFERPLNKRGRRDAPVMAERWASALNQSDLWISSPARRALSTAVLFADEANVDEDKIQRVQAIYEAHYSDLLKILNQLPEEVGSVILFGHNPGFSDLASYLTGMDVSLPTCAVVSLVTEMSQWALLSANTCSILKLDYPKNQND